MGLNVLDLIFTPLPQLLLQLGIKCLFIWKCDPRPGGEILLKQGIQVGASWVFLEAGILTLPLSSPAAGAVPAYKEVIAPYETEYVMSRPTRCTSEPG
jgi:hypothetical protein